MKKTYLFYDIETSGLNKAFDQVLQFAAIRTDSELNEIERHEKWVRLSADTIPSPGAVITHNIGPETTATGVPEIEAIVQIHQLFNTPGTISVGYNTLGFDDEFLRFSFYRNLLPPYTHQWANGCSRLDIFPLIPLYYLYKNECIKWPDPDVQGKISLKLEGLACANKLSVGAAHNAIVDVIATLELAKLLRLESKIWQYAIEFFDKNIVAERTQKLRVAFSCKEQTFPEGLFINVKSGYDQAYQAPVLALGAHNHYKNQMLWLRLDSEKLTQVTSDSIAENTWVFKLKAGEANFVLPMTERFSRLSPERQLLVEQNKKWLQENADLFFDIIDYHKNDTYPKIPNIDIDAALYQNGFLTNDEQQLCASFHAATSAQEKAAYLDVLPKKLCQQAVRIIGRNYPNHLPEKYAEEFAAYIRQVAAENENGTLIDYKGERRLTPKAALIEIQTLRANLEMTKDKQCLLDELEKYLHEKFS